MSELVAEFERRFVRGPTIEGRVRQPSDCFSLTVLFGPSGGGKSTVLRALAGLEQPQSGTIRFGDETWFDATTGAFVSPQRRGIGLLFQDYALFPHLSVEQNVAYGLTRLPQNQRAPRVAEMFERFELQELTARRINEISGGQQQRVALARVLACRPRLLLLDEPLTALDQPLREHLRGELRELLRSLAIPVVMVTHDRTEAIALADRVVVLVDGRVRQAGDVQDVFARPADEVVARYVGIESIEQGIIVETRDGLAAVDIGRVRLWGLAAGLGPRVHVCIRAEDVVLERGVTSGSSARNHLPAKVLSVVPEGALVRVLVDCGFRLTALVTRLSAEELRLAPGETITAVIKAPAVHLLPRG
ncbi:MAG: ABC transporter ATP-binding protein [Pirellulales bacterium]|nr:ABC transporter ATP-binding protein [Pirellulales bacterium]